MVLGGGLEPPRLTAYAPQTYVSAISPPELVQGREMINTTYRSRKVDFGRPTAVAILDENRSLGYGTCSQRAGTRAASLPNSASRLRYAVLVLPVQGGPLPTAPAPS